MGRIKLDGHQVETYDVTGTGSAQEVKHYFGQAPVHVEIIPLVAVTTIPIWTPSSDTKTAVNVTLENNKAHRVTIWPRMV